MTTKESINETFRATWFRVIEKVAFLLLIGMMTWVVNEINDLDDKMDNSAELLAGLIVQVANNRTNNDRQERTLERLEERTFSGVKDR